MKRNEARAGTRRVEVLRVAGAVGEPKLAGLKAAGRFAGRDFSSTTDSVVAEGAAARAFSTDRRLINGGAMRRKMKSNWSFMLGEENRTRGDTTQFSNGRATASVVS